MPKINFKASEQAPLDGGVYMLEVQSMEIKQSGPQSKNPGSAYIETWFIVVTGEAAQRRLPSNFSLLPQAGWKLKEFLEAADVPHEAIPGAAKGEFDISFNTEDCIGKRVLAEVGQETYQTKTGANAVRNSVDKLSKP